MRGTIEGRLGDVTKGEPGLSAYEVAVKHGFKGTEEEWLLSLRANARPAEEAATSAKSSADRAEAAASQAEAAASGAHTFARAAADSEQAAHDSKVSASESAKTAVTAAESAGTNAAYIQGRINQAVMCADQAAQSDSHATASAGAAWQSEANAKQSELMTAEYSLAAQRYVGEAATSASAAATSASEAASSATQASTLIQNFNANVDLAAEYASIAGGHANRSQTYAVSAADSADRAEAALGKALQPLADYYNKEQTREQITLGVAGEASIRAAADSALGASIDSLSAGMSNYYTKTEIDQQISAIPKYKTIVVQSLPVSDIDTEAIYLVVTGDETDNLYTEYIYVNNAWEKLGMQRLDLSGYQTLTDAAPYKEKLNGIEVGAQVNTITGVKGSNESAFRTGNIVITAGNVGLDNVDNTADSVKSVSLAGGLDNADSLESYAVGDVVFDGALSPHMCYVCVTGSAGA